MPHLTGLELPFPFYAVFALILGLIFGSFLNVVIYRVPRGLSVVFPGSHCGACGAPVKSFDNIPLVSYVALGGRCRSCRARISIVYPAVELLTGLIFVALVFKTGPSWEAALEFAFACVLIALIFIDSAHFLIPNVITYPAFLFALTATTARAGWGVQEPLNFDISFLIPGLQPEFTIWRAALIGALIFALAAPYFWLLDRLDPVLFGRYFDCEETNEDAAQTSAVSTVAVETKDESTNELEMERRHSSAIRATTLLGSVLALVWAVLIIYFSAKDQPAFEAAYAGLLRASVGALIIGGLTWLIRAGYFLVRGIEGMGLGDIKMISIIGAFMGWIGAFGVLLLGSIIGAIAGAILMYRSKQGLRTPLPFGVCLGVASLISLLI